MLSIGDRMSDILLFYLQTGCILLLLLSPLTSPWPRPGRRPTTTTTKEPNYENMSPREILQAEPLETCGRRPGFEKFLAFGHTSMNESGYQWDDWWLQFEEMSKSPNASSWPPWIPPKDLEIIMKNSTSRRCKPGELGCRNGATGRRRVPGRRAARRPSKGSHVTYGERAFWGEFPSYARLHILDQPASLDLPAKGPSDCGATIIGPRTLLSAGHCSRALPLEEITNIKVAVGMNSPFREDRKLYDLERVCKAHDWCLDNVVVSHVPAKIVWHDFMVLTTKEPIQYNDFVQPACVPYGVNMDMKPNEKTHLYGVGLGFVDEFRKFMPGYLRFTVFSVPCRGNEVNPGLMDPTLRCIKGAFGTNICKGDSGGPLYYEPEPYAPRQERRQFLAGIISIAYGYCKIYRDQYEKPKFFTDYVDVASIGPEIKDTMTFCNKPNPNGRKCEPQDP